MSCLPIDGPSRTVYPVLHSYSGKVSHKTALRKSGLNIFNDPNTSWDSIVLLVYVKSRGNRPNPDKLSQAA